ncbi:MAG: succinate dehydrogenase/fumarate reductase iron-sulfur subunit [Rhodospirillales bacterium]
MPQDTTSATLTVRVRRGKESGTWQEFEVPHRESQTVLDVVTWIQRNLDPTLSYRFACRVGMCGSCAMTVNGKPRWTCRTHVSRVAEGGAIEIAPLRNMPVIKDLACDMTEFFQKWQRAEARFNGKSDRTEPLPKIDPASPARVAASAGIECINCAVCYSACDVVTWKPDYLGPAALNRAWTLINDERDVSRKERLEAVASDAGCHSCHSQGSCTVHCPTGLNPSQSIAGLKKETMKALLKGELG